MGYVDKAVQALLTRGGQQLTPVGINAKVHDITEADTNHHLVDFVDFTIPLHGDIRFIYLSWTRISGTGSMDLFPMEGTSPVECGSVKEPVWFSTINNRIDYRLSVANDDFDLYCFGYLFTGRISG